MLTEGGRSAYDERRCFPVVNKWLWKMKQGEKKIADFGMPFESLRALSPSKGMVEGRIESRRQNHKWQTASRSGI